MSSKQDDECNNCGTKDDHTDQRPNPKWDCPTRLQYLLKLFLSPIAILLHFRIVVAVRDGRQNLRECGQELRLSEFLESLRCRPIETRGIEHFLDPKLVDDYVPISQRVDCVQIGHSEAMEENVIEFYLFGKIACGVACQ